MKQLIRLLAVLGLIIALACACAGAADPEPAEALVSSVIRVSYPDDRVFAIAPIGTEGTEFIVITDHPAEKPAVMIVDTAQPSAGVECCNRLILDGIPADGDKVQVLDHLSDGHPYVWYTETDKPDFLYVVFQKSEEGRWLVTEAQFGDDQHAFYWFRHDPEDRKIHAFLTGNEIAALPEDAIDLEAETFDPAAARQLLYDIMESTL